MAVSEELVPATKLAENESRLEFNDRVRQADNFLPSVSREESAAAALLPNPSNCMLTEIDADPQEEKAQFDDVGLVQPDREEPFGTLAEPFKCERIDKQYGSKLLSFEISEVQPRSSP